MDEIRCGSCRKLLARARAAELQIKRPRCGTMNSFMKAQSLPVERRRTPTDQEADHGNPQTPTRA